MTKYQTYLIKKYGTTHIKSRFQIAEEAMRKREAEEKQRRESEKKRREKEKQIKEKMKLINQNKNKDNYWLRVNLSDGGVAIYKDGKAYDLDTGLPVELHYIC